MATKKKGRAVKKVVRKVVRKKSTAAPAVPAAVSTAPVQELFTTQPQAERTQEVPAGQVLLFVNGSNKGLVPTEGKTLGDFVVGKAQYHGIRNFSVYADGVKGDTSMKDKSLVGVHKIEIVAKDSRG